MNQVDRREQLRAMEAEYLCPEDPFQEFPNGWVRAAELNEVDWSKISTKPISPEKEQHEAEKKIRRSPNSRVNRHSPIQIPVRRSARRRSVEADGGPIQPPPENQPRLVPTSPTDLPGVQAIPKIFNQFLNGMLAPGDFFVKSQTRFIGPFPEMPTENHLPSGDDYIILQRMGQLPNSKKGIFRQVGSLST